MNTVRHSVAAMVLLCMLPACGGGGDETMADPSLPSVARAGTASVRLEGCVLDDRDHPRAEGVHAFGADGRLLATAASNAQGIFVMTVPAGQPLSVGLDAPGHEALSLNTTDGNLSVSACLRTGQA